MEILGCLLYALGFMKLKGKHLSPIRRGERERKRERHESCLMLTCFVFQNAFPVSGQLYTVHLLSMEALLTVIDSTEAHCQAKVLSNIHQQEKEVVKSSPETMNSTKETNNSKIPFLDVLILSLVLC